jgi:hypothetical protein
MSRPNATDRYLVQFRKIGKLHFKTDCAFRDGQLDAARGYVIRVLSTLCASVAAGRVLDADTDTVVYQNSNQPGGVAWSAGQAPGAPARRSGGGIERACVQNIRHSM